MKATLNGKKLWITPYPACHGQITYMHSKNKYQRIKCLACDGRGIIVSIRAEQTA